MPDTSTSVEIRDLRADDRLADDMPRPSPDTDDTDSPRWRRSRVAVVDGQVVATATVVRSPVIDSYFCEVNVASEYRRRGIGTNLYRAIYATIDPRFPMLARAMSSKPVRRAFAESIGYSILVHCPEPWVDPTSQPAQQWIAAQNLPVDQVTVPMDDLEVDQVFAAWAAYFAWAHQSFGTVRTDRLPELWGSYCQGVDPQLSMLSLDRHSGKIVAFSLVTPDAWNGRTMIVSETVDRAQPRGADLLKATVAASLNLLAQRGVQRVELEGHTTDPHSPTLFESLPSGGGDPMDILELAAPKRR